MGYKTAGSQRANHFLFANIPLDLAQFQQNIESITDRNLPSGAAANLLKYLGGLFNLTCVSCS